MPTPPSPATPKKQDGPTKPRPNVPESGGWQYLKSLKRWGWVGVGVVACAKRLLRCSWKTSTTVVGAGGAYLLWCYWVSNRTTVMLIGPQGAGKTSLVKAILLSVDSDQAGTLLVGSRPSSLTQMIMPYQLDWLTRVVDFPGLEAQLWREYDEGEMAAMVDSAKLNPEDSASKSRYKRRVIFRRILKRLRQGFLLPRQVFSWISGGLVDEITMQPKPWPTNPNPLVSIDAALVVISLSKLGSALHVTGAGTKDKPYSFPTPDGLEGATVLDTFLRRASAMYGDAKLSMKTPPRLVMTGEDVLRERCARVNGLLSNGRFADAEERIKWAKESIAEAVGARVTFMDLSDPTSSAAQASACAALQDAIQTAVRPQVSAMTLLQRYITWAANE